MNYPLSTLKNKWQHNLDLMEEKVDTEWVTEEGMDLGRVGRGEEGSGYGQNTLYEILKELSKIVFFF